MSETKASGLIASSLPAGHYVAGLDLNDTTSGKSEPFSGDHNASGLAVPAGSEVSTTSEMPSGSELSTGDYDYSEEYDNEPQISGYVIDDSVRGEWRRRENVVYEMWFDLSNVASEEIRCFSFLVAF